MFWNVPLRDWCIIQRNGSRWTFVNTFLLRPFSVGDRACIYSPGTNCHIFCGKLVRHTVRSWLSMKFLWGFYDLLVGQNCATSRSFWRRNPRLTCSLNSRNVLHWLSCLNINWRVNILSEVSVLFCFSRGKESISRKWVLQRLEVPSGCVSGCARPYLPDVTPRELCPVLHLRRVKVSHSLCGFSKNPPVANPLIWLLALHTIYDVLVHQSD